MSKYLKISRISNYNFFSLKILKIFSLPKKNEKNKTLCLPILGLCNSTRALQSSPSLSRKKIQKKNKKTHFFFKKKNQKLLKILFFGQKKCLWWWWWRCWWWWWWTRVKQQYPLLTPPPIPTP